MQILAVANHKGGTGKTTLSVHLAAGLGRRGHRVLLMDLDPQANATSWLLPPLPAGAKGAAESMLGGRLAALPTTDRLWVSPATPALADLDLALAQELAGEYALKRVLASGDARDFDYVVLDCPPNLGLTVVNALCASTAIVAPVLGSYLSLVGLGKLEATVERVRTRCHVRTRVLGYVLFAIDGRESISGETREVLRKEGKLFRSEVRVSTAAKSLPAQRRTAWDPSADARGAEDYQAVLSETLKRLTTKGRAA